jgi:hypothetical protein
MSDNTYVKALRLDSSTLAQIEAYRQQMQKQVGPALHVHESAAIRALILRGLASVYEQETAASVSEVGQSDEAPVVSTSAPARSRSAPAVGMQHCDAGMGHPDYSIRSKECPKCANNRRARESKSRKKQGQK